MSRAKQSDDQCNIQYLKEGGRGPGGVGGGVARLGPPDWNGWYEGSLHNNELWFNSPGKSFSLVLRTSFKWFFRHLKIMYKTVGSVAIKLPFVSIFPTFSPWLEASACRRRGTRGRSPGTQWRSPGAPAGTRANLLQHKITLLSIFFLFFIVLWFTHKKKVISLKEKKRKKT